MNEKSLTINQAIHLLLCNFVHFLDADVENDNENDFTFVGWWDEKKNKYIIELETQ